MEETVFKIVTNREGRLGMRAGRNQGYTLGHGTFEIHANSQEKLSAHIPNEFGVEAKTEL